MTDVSATDAARKLADLLDTVDPAGFEGLPDIAVRRHR
jgi:hypothetical protein